MTASGDDQPTRKRGRLVPIPVLTGILGIMTIFTGAILAWFARKPIVLQPSAPSKEEVAAVGA